MIITILSICVIIMMLNSSTIQQDAIRALAEDVGPNDVSALLLPAHLQACADIINREPLVVCGQPWVVAVFALINPMITIDWLVKEGDYIALPTTLCRINGVARDILTAERTALNFLQTLSATATQTYRYVAQIKHTNARLLDTRKTLPGLRYAQKYAVTVGGGLNHRQGLYDAFLIKENHIKVCGSITNAINSAKKAALGLLIEIEVENIAELQEALQAGPDRILLDNFTHAMLCEAVLLNSAYRCELEASGGIDLTTIATVAETGVDYISVGAITKSIAAIDLSLLVGDVA
jgi:nicotinate-nucleotide pyrophosphorylase (carboxylating)